MSTSTISNLQLSLYIHYKIQELEAHAFPWTTYKITHFHPVFFIKIIDVKAYLFLQVVIHIFVLEPNIFKLNRSKNPREMSPVFLNSA